MPGMTMNTGSSRRRRKTAWFKDTEGNILALIQEILTRPARLQPGTFRRLRPAKSVQQENRR